MHSLLEIQIEKSKNLDGTISYEKLFDLINKAYEKADKERSINKSTLKTISEDLLESNNYLKEQDDYFRLSQERYELALRGTNDGIWDCDLANGNVFYSERWKEILGLETDVEIIALNDWLSRIHPHYKKEIQKIWDKNLKDRVEKFYAEYPILHNNQKYIWVLTRGIFTYDENGVPSRFVGSQTDISQLKEMEAKLSFYSSKDALTSLANRYLLYDRLNQAIADANRHQKQVAVIFFDLDRFKFINDSYGHKVGDAIIQIAAKRLMNCVRETDTVARQGGDEFVVILRGLDNEYNLLSFLNKAIENLGSSYHVDENEFNLTVSAGISIFPKDGQNADLLLANADTAMYRSKKEGGNRFQFFTKEMNEKLLQKLDLEIHLRKATKSGGFTLNYQPIIDLKKKKIIGCEALIRWNHPTLGWISPMDFIPLAEEVGLIGAIGEWVLLEACQQMKKWHDKNLPRLYVSVNVSGHQLRYKNITKEISNIIELSGLEPKYVELELTESAVFETNQDSINILNALKEIGLELAIDDFGTGYSNLSYLKHLPISKLKIDRAFITPLGENEDDEKIVKAILGLADILNLKVTAEGVETKKQLDFLIKNGCSQVQGYFYSKPLAAESFEEFLLKGINDLA